MEDKVYILVSIVPLLHFIVAFGEKIVTITPAPLFPVEKMSLDYLLDRLSLLLLLLLSNKQYHKTSSISPARKEQIMLSTRNRGGGA